MKALAIAVAGAALVACSAYSEGDAPLTLRPRERAPSTEAPVLTDTDADAAAPEAVPSSGIFASTATSLYHFDPKTKTLRKMGSFDCVAGVRDIAIDRSGVMYGLGDRASSTVLVIIDRGSAKCTERRTFAAGERLDGLAFVSTGAGQDRLVSTRNGQYVSIATADGAVASLGTLGGLPAGHVVTELVSHAGVGTFVVHMAPGGGQQLIRINSLTGALEAVMRNITWPHVAGLTYRDFTLYGFTGDRRVVTIDPISATMADVSTAFEADAPFTAATAPAGGP